MYDELVNKTGHNPVEALFTMAKNRRNDSSIRVKANIALIQYRFAKPYTEKGDEQQGELSLVWSDGEAV